MKILVTGSAGHLGEALMRTLRSDGHEPIGLDIKTSPYTTHVGSIVDRDFVNACAEGAQAILHAATLHKPHVETHSRQDFIDTNITGTANLLEAAAANRMEAFVYTSTTSAFGDAMHAAAGEPAVWVTEALRPQPKNIYGVTKTAAEDLCILFSRNHGVPCVVLRTSRFFPERDDNDALADIYSGANLKVNELLYRRVDIQDVVQAHTLALSKAQELTFDRFIISAATPFQPGDAAQLGVDVPAVLQRYVPEFAPAYERLGWHMLPALDRVYDSTRAREVLGWVPEYDFKRAVQDASAGADYRSPLALAVGAKGYHDASFPPNRYSVPDDAQARDGQR